MSEQLAANGIRLDPYPDARRRGTLFAVLTGVAIGLTDWTPFAIFVQKVPATLTLLIMLGTYRQVEIIGDRLQTQMFFCFKGLKRHRWKLNRVAGLEVNMEETNALSDLLGYAFPWAGSLGIWLRMVSDKRIRAWQGANQLHFDDALRQLQNATGAEISRSRGSVESSESIFD